MATPYIVGCVALYLEGRPNGDLSAEAIKTAFQNNGQPRNDKKVDFKGYASVTQQGAGLISMMDVLSNQASVTPSCVSLNDTAHINAKQTFTITNRGTDTIQYSVQVIPAAGLLPFDEFKMVDKTPKKVRAPASVQISESTVEVGPGAAATVDMTFTGPATDPDQYVIYSGFVRFTPETVTKQTPVMHVPYMGMQGNFKSVSILDPTFGLHIFDGHGKPLRPNAPQTGEHAHVGTDSVVDEPVMAMGIAEQISHEIGTHPSHGDGDNLINDNSGGDDAGATGRPRPSANEMKIVFRMITASEILVLDLVSDKGSDPYQVESYGLLKNGVAKYIPRNDQLEGNVFQVMGWNGELLQDDGSVVAVQGNTQLSENGMYRLRISLLKHFGNLVNDTDFEVHMSEPFSLR